MKREKKIKGVKTIKEVVTHDSLGELSTTKMMNISSYLMVVLLFIIAIVLNIFKIHLQAEIFAFVTFICGLSYGQYSYGKKLKNGKKK